MSVYQEKWPNKFWGIIIVLAGFFLICQPWLLGERELYGNEGGYATQAMEMEWTFPVSAVAHGVAIQDAFPLLPLIAATLQKECGIPLPLGLRLISVAMLFGIALTAYYAAGSARNYKAGLVAFAAVVSSVLAFDKLTAGSPASLTVFFVFAAHLLIFHYGMREGKWNKAWLLALLLMTFGFFSGGFVALLYFVFPLLFLRRPLTLWSRLNRYGVYAGILVLLAAIGCWLAPYLYTKNLPVEYWISYEKSFAGYWLDLLNYPFYVFIRFFPWSLLGWIPFCVALFGVDETPLFSRYLRTLIIANFFLLWFLPGAEPEDMLLLAGPFAVALGITYQMALRRYGWKIRKFLVSASAFFVLCCGVVVVGFYLLPEKEVEKLSAWSRSLSFRHDQTVYWQALIAGGAMLVALWVFYKFGRQKWGVWLFLMLAGIAAAMPNWQISHPYKAQDDSKRKFGEDIKNALTKDGAEKIDLIYKIEISDLYGEFYYTGKLVKKIESLNELPPGKTVYLVSVEFPQNPKWTWSNLLPPDYSYRNRRIRFWKGVPAKEAAN